MATSFALLGPAVQRPLEIGQITVAIHRRGFKIALAFRCHRRLQGINPLT
ncbi:hypothetical protein [Pseudomonas sp. v388]|nr:hypothetical protein [Pseudomonas sp. v388]